MPDSKQHSTPSSAVLPKAAGNPEGKGLNGLLRDWQQNQPRGVVAKPRRQLLAEFFTSMLVLSAKFKYKPSEGVANYLYLAGDDWLLSLIAPEQWSEERRRGFVGTCVLQGDMTWTIEPSARLSEKGPVIDAVRRFFDAFAEKMDTDATLEDILPYCIQKMPYYQRLYANALSRSIRASVILGGQTDIPAREWQDRLPSFVGSFLLNKQ